MIGYGEGQLHTDTGTKEDAAINSPSDCGCEHEGGERAGGLIGRRNGDNTRRLKPLAAISSSRKDGI